MVSNNVGLELDDQDSSEPKNISNNSLWIQFFTDLALSIWIACVAVSSTVLLMLMTGMLNRALPKKAQRDEWVEINNQILNALFTFMCLFQHPKIIRHTRLLLRQRPGDVIWLRKAYCKKGTKPRPHERAHITVVVILLHVNFLAQYVSCGLFLGYNRVDRPNLFVWISMGVTIIAPVAAGAYMFLSPLRRENETKITDEEQIPEPASRAPGP